MRTGNTKVLTPASQAAVKAARCVVCTQSSFRAPKGAGSAGSPSSRASCDCGTAAFPAPAPFEPAPVP